jgi:hypothetical protein
LNFGQLAVKRRSVKLNILFISLFLGGSIDKFYPLNYVN